MTTTTYVCRHCGQPAYYFGGGFLHIGRPAAWLRELDAAQRCIPGDPDSPTCEAIEAEIATDGNCRLSWVDNVPTSMTPTPSARCPFEYFHVYDESRDDAPVIGAEPIPPDYPVQPVPCPWCDAKPYARHDRTCPV